MPGLRRIAVVAVAISLTAAPEAVAEDFCVAPLERDLCTPVDSLQDALDQHAAGDRVFLPDGTHSPTVPTTGFSDAGAAVAIIGSGPQTVLSDNAAFTLQLASPASSVEDVRIEATGGLADTALVSAGSAQRIEVAAASADRTAVELLAGGRLADSKLEGALYVRGTADVETTRITAAGPAGVTVDSSADVVLDDISVELEPGAGSGLLLACVSGDVSVTARHITVAGAGDHVATIDCDGAENGTLELRNSLLRDYADPFLFSSEGAVTTAYSAHAEDADAVAEFRLDSDAPLVDRGDPAPLTAGVEPFTDLAGFARVTDGDGDGIVRRDVGASELQPPAAPIPPENVLANPGAENGTAGWEGTFTSAPFGSDPFLPGAPVGAALGAGTAFFTAADVPTAASLQRIDVAPSARAIDGGRATAMLSGLLGGYGPEADEITVEAIFRDPEGFVLGPRLLIGPVSPAERGGATNLLLRSAAAAIPARTRAIDVTIRGTRAGGAYTDAYADNLGLVLSVPGTPVGGPVDPGKPVVPGLKPFAGVSVLTGRARVSPTRRVKVRLACVSATVGSCRGTLELRTRLPRAEHPERIAQFGRFSIAPGRQTWATLRLTLAARRALRRRTAINTRLVTVARDGQGVQRRRTVPLRLLLRKR